LKHEIDDLKQVHDDMSAKLVEHNEKSANLEKVKQNYDLVDACHDNNYFKAKLDDSHIDASPLRSLHNDMSDKDCDFCLLWWWRILPNYKRCMLKLQVNLRVPFVR
jgi:hypothetical protein